MKMSEEFFEQLQKRYKHVYEWEDGPNTTYEAHAHVGAVTLCVVKGGLEFDLQGEKRRVESGVCFDVPIGVEHTAVVDDTGATFIVGEEIEGDS